MRVYMPRSACLYMRMCDCFFFFIADFITLFYYSFLLSVQLVELHQQLALDFIVTLTMSVEFLSFLFLRPQLEVWLVNGPCVASEPLYIKAEHKDSHSS